MALILDGTDGIGISGGTQPLDPASLNAVIQALIPTGTKMMFVQTNAPTGWTKDTTHDNKALRLVSGTASTGGTVAFTTAFASQAVSGTVANHTLSTAQLAAHSHGVVVRHDYSANTANPPFIAGTRINNATNTLSTNNAGGGSAHNHGFTGTAINMAVQYVDTIIATKD